MTNLPNFFDIDLENYNQQLNKMLDEYRKHIAELSKQPEPSWQSLMQPLEEIDDELNQFWSPVSHLHSVVNSEQLRKVYQDAIMALSKYSTELGQNEELYKAIKSVEPQNEVQKKILEDELLGFKLSGVALATEKKKVFAELQTKLSELETKFENNLLDATNAWKKEIDDVAQLKGMPEHAINTAKALGQQKGNYVLTLDYPCFNAVMTYAEDQQLRQEIYHAYVTRASELGPNANQYDNSELIKEILSLKHQKAQLLDFENYAELSLATKMAPSTKRVMQFLNELAENSYGQAKQEFKSLEEYANQQLNPWDITYYSEKQKHQLYDVSQEELRAYFPQSKTIKGMFSIIAKLYGIHFEQKSEVKTWHPDVVYYELYNSDGTTRGGVYMDLYARENKRGGAWMADCISYRHKKDDSIQKPVAFLTCNFAPPSNNQEAYFSHDEVVTLFHEFGHCLHHLLTTVPYLSASGISGVEWDAVELPSQFFENFCWQKESLLPLTKHKETGETLPDELFEKLLRAKNFQSAMAMLRQLEFATFDFSIHQQYNPSSPEDVLTTLKKIREKISVIPTTDYNRFPNSFSHIFAGGYAAGYYSYKWAEVLSSDAFARFEEEGIFSETVGKDFLNEILCRGSSRKALESFIAFRGREPKTEALMRHSGIATK